MDKITRMLLLYSKLIRGEPVSKISFCMETESNGRSFDRDIEDIRLFLAESFSTEEVVYNRGSNCYVLTGVVKQDIELIEFRFLERLLIQAGLLRKDELIGILSILATNTSNPQECLRIVKEHTANYPTSTIVPLLKMHDDIVSMISNKTIIEIKYHEDDGTVKIHSVIPYDVEFSNGKMYLLAFKPDVDRRNTIYYLLDRIESFEKKRNISSSMMPAMDDYRKKRQLITLESDCFIEIQCENLLSVKEVQKRFKDKVRIEQDTGKVSLSCNQGEFIEWILGQKVENYTILSPPAVREDIRKRVVDLYQRYGKE